MPYKMLALDIDGTLLTSTRVLTPRTKQAVIKLQQQGWLVTLVSGRRHTSMLSLAGELELNAPIVAFNGGLIVDAAKEMVLAKKDMPLESIREILLAWQAAKVNFRLNTSSFHGPPFYYYENPGSVYGFRERMYTQELREGRRFYQVDEIDFNPLRLIVGGTERETTLAKEVATPWLDGANLWALHLQDYDELWFLEIFPGEMHKGIGLSNLCSLLSISPAACIAIGDQLNDIEMLQTAGLGIAMGNSVPAVKEAAQMVIGDHNEEGLAIFIEELLAGSLRGYLP